MTPFTSYIINSIIAKLARRNGKHCWVVQLLWHLHLKVLCYDRVRHQLDKGAVQVARQVFRYAVVTGLLGTMVVGASACGKLTASHPPLAVVNGESLTRSDWTLAVHATDLLQGVSLPTSPSAMKHQVKEITVEMAVEQWALHHHWITPAKAKQVATEFLNENVMIGYGGKKGLNAALARDHMTVSQLQNFLVGQMELQAAYAHVARTVSAVPSSTVHAYYNTHHAQFISASQDELRMIVVKQQSLAKSIESQLEHGGSWNKLAQQYSLDQQSKNRGGEYGWVSTGPQSGLMPSLYKTMDGLKVGQYAVAKDSQGYSVMQVQASKPGTLQSYTTVEKTLANELLGQKQQKAFNTFSQHVAKKSSIKIHMG